MLVGACACGWVVLCARLLRRRCPGATMCMCVLLVYMYHTYIVVRRWLGVCRGSAATPAPASACGCQCMCPQPRRMHALHMAWVHCQRHWQCHCVSFAKQATCWL